MITKSETLVWEKLFSIEMPLQWEYDEEDGIISVYDPNNGAGALQFSFATRNKAFPPDEAELVLACQHYAGQNDRSLDRSDLQILHDDNSLIAEFSYIDDEEIVWRVWHILSHHKLAVVTYNCDRDDFHVDKEYCDFLVKSFQWI